MSGDGKDERSWARAPTPARVACLLLLSLLPLLLLLLSKALVVVGLRPSSPRLDAVFACVRFAQWTDSVQDGMKIQRR